MSAMSEQPLEVISATDAAERLGVSASGLRRLGSIYSQVHGELPRERNTEKRIWTSEVIERLAQARALVEAERYRSIKEALEALDRGVADVVVELAPQVQPPLPEALEVLLDEIKTLNARLAAYEQLEARLASVERLEEEVRAMRQQLEAPKRIAVIDNSQADELRWMNGYLLGELERRRLEGERNQKKYQWWKFWQRPVKP